MLPFEFTIEGPPVSQQTRRQSRLRAWVELVRQEAQRFWPPGEPPPSEAAALDRDREFLHVIVTDAPDQEVLG